MMVIGDERSQEVTVKSPKRFVETGRGAPWTIRTYVLDTNVLIQASYVVSCLEGNHIVLPMMVLGELDNLKKVEGERGASARASIRMLERLRMRGDLLKGIMLENGGTLRAKRNYVDVELPFDLPEEKANSHIPKVRGELTEQRSAGELEREKPPRVILMVRDTLLRIKAQIIGI